MKKKYSQIYLKLPNSKNYKADCGTLGWPFGGFPLFLTVCLLQLLLEKPALCCWTLFRKIPLSKLCVKCPVNLSNISKRRKSMISCRDLPELDCCSHEMPFLGNIATFRHYSWGWPDLQTSLDPVNCVPGPPWSMFWAGKASPWWLKTWFGAAPTHCWEGPVAFGDQVFPMFFLSCDINKNVQKSYFARRTEKYRALPQGYP